jgi:hypothetical protein
MRAGFYGGAVLGAMAIGKPAWLARARNRLVGTGADAFVFPASLAFRGDRAYVANLSFGAAGGKVSVVGIPASP